MRVAESIRLHGSRQIEFKQGLVMAPGDTDCRYAVETYFFLPAVLLVNRDTYPSEEFLRNLKNYVRMRPPQRPLSTFLAGGVSRELLAVALKRPKERRERALKRFGLGIRAAFKAAIRPMVKGSGALKKGEPDRVLDEVRAVLNGWRNEILPSLREEDRVAGAAVDEFLSVTSAVFSKKLLATADQKDWPRKAREAVEKFQREETAYRLAHYPETATSVAPEQALYRWRTLRKYVSNVLFLRPKVGEGNPWLKQFIYGAAAAFAMLFATFVAFFWQSRYGALSMNLFIALVVAYIFKDRLKEGLREALAKVFRRWLPNRRTILMRPDGEEAGRTFETVDFMKADEIPPEVLALRRAAHSLPFSDEYRESILRYRKSVEIDAEVIAGEFGARSLYDITRMLVTPWTASIDRRFEELPYVDDEDDASTDTAAGRHQEHLIEKRYHVYLVRVVETGAGKTADVMRIILSEAGVCALEAVKASEPL